MGWRRLTVDGGRQTVFDLCLSLNVGFKGLRARRHRGTTRRRRRRRRRRIRRRRRRRIAYDDDNTRGWACNCKSDSLLVQRLRLATPQPLPLQPTSEKTNNHNNTFACGWRPRIASLFDSQRSRGFVMLVVETRQLLSAPITRRIFFNRPLPGPLRTNPPACLISIPP